MKTGKPIGNHSKHRTAKPGNRLGRRGRDTSGCIAIRGVRPDGTPNTFFVSRLNEREQEVADRIDLPWRDAGSRVRSGKPVAPHPPARSVRYERDPRSGMMMRIERRG